MTLSELLKQYRKAKDLSQRDFARRCGLSHSLISILEMGVNPQTGKKPQPDLDTYQKLAIGMNRSVQDLFMDLGDSESVLLRVGDSVPKRMYATDAMPKEISKAIGIPQFDDATIDEDLMTMLNMWKVATPERRKSFIRVFKAMDND